MFVFNSFQFGTFLSKTEIVSIGQVSVKKKERIDDFAIARES